LSVKAARLVSRAEIPFELPHYLFDEAGERELAEAPRGNPAWAADALANLEVQDAQATVGQLAEAEGDRVGETLASNRQPALPRLSHSPIRHKPRHA
jgi:hypothetical protein